VSSIGSLTAGMQVLAGDRLLTVSPELAAAFGSGDRVIAVDDALLHVPARDQALVDACVSAAVSAFGAVSSAVSDGAITAFFAGFADRLADDATFAPIAAANADDVSAARARGRSTTRLVLSDKMRADMVAGLRAWRDSSSSRDAVVSTIDHEGWSVEQRRAPLGVVGFVFEGRPNVFADATGVLRTGNTVVFRIGSDALGTARAIMEHAVRPALAAAGLPDGAVGLLDSPSRATGWALFSHRSLGLAVARGSGSAVAQLGGVARQAGVPVSLHGTGGAWIVASASVVGPDDVSRFRQTVRWSLDRKVCNTLNVCVLIESNAAALIPEFLSALAEAATARGSNAKLHVVDGVEHPALDEWFARRVSIDRAEGAIDEASAERMPADDLGTEWEWEGSPEVSLVVAPDLAAAVELFNSHSPRLVASLISSRADEHDQFYRGVDCPFVGDGFTRWVDGQFALNAPELGLSNWENGRLFARSAVLSGDSVFTIRTRVRQSDPALHR
jgi:glutamate-5-semialdehyde dehydrogenase